MLSTKEYKETLQALNIEISKCSEAISQFTEKINLQGNVKNARDTEHLERLKTFKIELQTELNNTTASGRI